MAPREGAGLCGAAGAEAAGLPAGEGGLRGGQGEVSPGFAPGPLGGGFAVDRNKVRRIHCWRKERCNGFNSY